MIRRILVPLDGSSLAEATLPPAICLAQSLRATVVLFHAIEAHAPAAIHGQRHLATVEEARTYLDEVAVRFTTAGIALEIDIHPVEEPDVALSIATHINELKADLVMLASHGSGGLRDALVGSIAQQVIQQGTAPVFIVRPKEGDAGRPFTCRSILAPLDGTAVHEPALPLAEELARACSADLHLVMVVPTAGTVPAERGGTAMLLPSTTRAILDLAERGAADYLQEKLRPLLQSGLDTGAEVVRGEVTAAIVDAAQRHNVDLIVMGTHARHSWDAFWSGSVTPKVMSRVACPVLLVRVQGQETPR